MAQASCDANSLYSAPSCCHTSLVKKEIGQHTVVEDVYNFVLLAGGRKGSREINAVAVLVVDIVVTISDG